MIQYSRTVKGVIISTLEVVAGSCPAGRFFDVTVRVPRNISLPKVNEGISLMWPKEIEKECCKTFRQWRDVAIKKDRFFFCAECGTRLED